MTWRRKPIATKPGISNKTANEMSSVRSLLWWEKVAAKLIFFLLHNNLFEIQMSKSYLSGENLEKLLLVGISPARLL